MNIDWGQTFNAAIIGGLIGLAIAIVYSVLRFVLKTIVSLLRRKK